MTSYLLAGAVEEPVSLAAMKAHLRVEDEAEDGLIETLISAARVHVESLSGRALLDQTWRLTLDAWPEDRIVPLPVSPVTALSEIRAYDAGGTVHQIDVAQFLLDGRANPARIIVPAVIAGMPVLRARRGIEIDYTAGYGEAEDVPADLSQAVRMLAAFWYENRDLATGEMRAVPGTIGRMVSAYRRVRL
ncbi:MAG TPA: head-tail connector protein [Pelagibacterium sp.]|uniref:head-tail connector protein n=1 Tax=Pelagibacterium sp. TaxID=1967288 RepID=UPI002C393735|nr:head-tail connector protein [Pelagibacterium sp.]HWJ88909.1 head-tail connector protein [Pelagibacterium sp.]